VAYKIKINLPGIGHLGGDDRPHERLAEPAVSQLNEVGSAPPMDVNNDKPVAAATMAKSNRKGRPVWRWAIDISDPARIKRININDKEQYPVGVPSSAILKRVGFGKGPRQLAIRLPVNGNKDGDYEFADLYERIMAQNPGSTPLQLYVDLMQPQLRKLVNTSPNIWHRVQTGAYITALIVLIIVVALIIVILLGG